MNIVTLMGRLTRDPSYNEVQNEKGVHKIVSFYLAVPRNFGSEVNYIKVTAFGKQAEFARDYLKKGKRVAVVGELITGSYTDQETGKTMRTAEVTASRIEFADGKDNNQPVPMPETDADGFMNIPDGIDAELPFM